MQGESVDKKGTVLEKRSSEGSWNRLQTPCTCSNSHALTLIATICLYAKGHNFTASSADACSPLNMQHCDSHWIDRLRAVLQHNLNSDTTSPKTSRFANYQI